MVKTTVGGIITKWIDEEKHVLLTKRSIAPYNGFWCFPGGHIDTDETAKTAIIREVEEETGLIFDGDFLFYFDEIIPEKNIHAVVLFYSGTANGNILIREEVSEIKWFKITDAEKLSLAFQHNKVLTRFINS
jgi:dATP pyrophosphohydrolase